MASYDLFSEEFDLHIKTAVAKAIEETLRAGVPVFYSDASGIEIKEMPDGRKFEIRYIPDAPGDSHYEIVRELTSAAA